MNTPTLTVLLQLAAVSHLGLLWAGLTMPNAINLRSHLASIPAFIRRLFYVDYAFIGMTLVAFGLLTFLYAGPMAAGEPVARALCVFMAAFWIVRLGAAVFVFDVKPYLRSRFLRLGYFALNGVFIYLVVLYTFVAWKGGSL